MAETPTPGEWTVGELDRNGQRIVRGEHYELATCWHHCLGSIEQEMEANARLFAASKDLLSIVRHVDDFVTRGECCPVCSQWPHHEHCAIVVALAKAEGR